MLQKHHLQKEAVKGVDAKVKTIDYLAGISTTVVHGRSSMYC